MIKLAPITQIHMDEENPRKNDKWRLELTELSLRKLGFLLPLYVDENMTILSGHQRKICALKLGFKEVPVVIIRTKGDDERRSTNLLFNRATNEFAKISDGDNNVQQLKKAVKDNDFDSIPDIKPGTKESFPCVYQIQLEDTKQLAAKNFRSFNPHKAALAKSLANRVKDLMPVVITTDKKVINGIGRLQYAVESSKKVVKCIEVRDDQKELANVMLNLLSMDFDINGAHADALRYNSFMRPQNTREYDPETGSFALADGFFKGIYPNNNGRDFFKISDGFKKTFIKKYGDSIVDFGAGKLENTRKLREAGIKVSAFEPYFVGSGENISKNKSLEINRKFLEEIRCKNKINTVFMTNVYNSVPFMGDRKKIAIITAALCYPEGKTVCWCQSDKSSQFDGSFTAEAGKKRLSFRMNYEPNTVLASVGKIPKIQKGHTKEELEEIFSPCFDSIDRIERIGAFYYVECSKPKINKELLREALEFEFELPYPDGTRMGLGEEAKRAFSKRLGIEL